MSYLDEISSRKKDKLNNDQKAILGDSMAILAGAFSKISLAKGEPGKDGKDGHDGKNGKNGKNGKDGKDGHDGKNGKNGLDGVNGNDGQTPIKGVHYFDGKDGKDGADGLDGKSAFEVAKENGFVGTEKAWLKSLKGKDGINTFVTNNKNPYATVGYSKIKEIKAGTNITIDNSNEEYPIVSSTGGSGSGDVVGPAIAADSNLAAFDTTTGKLIKDSGSKASDFVTGTPWTSEGYLTDISGQDLSTADNATSAFITVADIPAETDPAFTTWLGSTPPAYPGDIPDVSGLVPYTGAASDVDLDTHNLRVTTIDAPDATDLTIVGGANGGNLSLYASPNNGGNGGYFDMHGGAADGVDYYAGDVYIYGGYGSGGARNGDLLLGAPGYVRMYNTVDSSSLATLNPDSLTANHTYTFPDKDGTFAMTDDIPDISGKEDSSNKVTSISGVSTDTQYPSAKLLYDQLALKAAALGDDDNYVTDAEKIVIGNTSGTNTGDNAANSSSLPIGGGTLTGAAIAADHGTASTAQIINVCYGTGVPPDASTTPEGTLYVTYTA